MKLLLKGLLVVGIWILFFALLLFLFCLFLTVPYQIAYYIIGELNNTALFVVGSFQILVIVILNRMNYSKYMISKMDLLEELSSLIMKS
jgi:hypothetical protein